MSAVVARLDRPEGVHFDARGPADFGATGSTTIKTLNRLVTLVRPLRSVVPLVLRAPATCRPRSANRFLLQLQLIPRRRPLSNTSTPPPAARLFNCLNQARLSLAVGLWRWRKTVTVAVSSAVPSRLLLLTTRRPSSKYRHLFVGAQFGCGFEMSLDLKIFTSPSPKFHAARALGSLRSLPVRLRPLGISLRLVSSRVSSTAILPSGFLLGAASPLVSQFA